MDRDKLISSGIVPSTISAENMELCSSIRTRPLIPGYMEMAYDGMNDYCSYLRNYIGFVYNTTRKGKKHEHIKFAPDASYILTNSNDMDGCSSSLKRCYDHSDDEEKKTEEETDYDISISIYNDRVDFTYDDVPLYITNHIYERHLAVSYSYVFKYSTLKLGYPSSFDINKLLDAAVEHDTIVYKSDIHLRIFHNNSNEWIQSCSIDFRSIDNVFLPKKDITAVFERIDRFLNPKTKKLYKLLGMKQKLTILFAGVPGAGKTSFISAIASKYKYNLCNLKYQKTTDADLITLGSDLPKSSILTMEDLDCVIYERKQNDENHITFAGLLSFLDGTVVRDGTIIFITTNHKDKFDPALLRPGRIDFVVSFNYATSEQIGDMFSRYMSVDMDTVEIHTDADYLAQVAEARKKFVTKVSKLCIPITCSIIQQYLINYIGKMDDALANVEKIKEMFNALPSDDPSKLYS